MITDLKFFLHNYRFEYVFIIFIVKGTKYRVKLL